LDVNKEALALYVERIMSKRWYEAKCFVAIFAKNVYELSPDDVAFTDAQEFFNKDEQMRRDALSWIEALNKKLKLIPKENINPDFDTISQIAYNAMYNCISSDSKEYSMKEACEEAARVAEESGIRASKQAKK
jgi:hypothetical protein